MNQNALSVEIVLNQFQKNMVSLLTSLLGMISFIAGFSLLTYFRERQKPKTMNKIPKRQLHSVNFDASQCTQNVCCVYATTKCVNSAKTRCLHCPHMPAFPTPYLYHPRYAYIALPMLTLPLPCLHDPLYTYIAHAMLT